MFLRCVSINKKLTAKSSTRTESPHATHFDFRFVGHQHLVLHIHVPDSAADCLDSGHRQWPSILANGGTRKKQRVNSGLTLEHTVNQTPDPHLGWIW
jgi:hypothetical protein